MSGRKRAPALRKTSKKKEVGWQAATGTGHRQLLGADSRPVLTSGSHTSMLQGIRTSTNAGTRTADSALKAQSKLDGLRLLETRGSQPSEKRMACAKLKSGRIIDLPTLSWGCRCAAPAPAGLTQAAALEQNAVAPCRQLAPWRPEKQQLIQEAHVWLHLFVPAAAAR